MKQANTTYKFALTSSDQFMSGQTPQFRQFSDQDIDILNTKIEQSSLEARIDEDNSTKEITYTIWPQRKERTDITARIPLKTEIKKTHSIKAYELTIGDMKVGIHNISNYGKQSEIHPMLQTIGGSRIYEGGIACTITANTSIRDTTKIEQIEECIKEVYTKGKTTKVKFEY